MVVQASGLPGHRPGRNAWLQVTRRPSALFACQRTARLITLANRTEGAFCGLETIAIGKLRSYQASASYKNSWSFDSKHAG